MFWGFLKSGLIRLNKVSCETLKEPVPISVLEAWVAKHRVWGSLEVGLWVWKQGFVD